VPIWKRREPLHERLLRAAGLTAGAPVTPPDLLGRLAGAGIHGLHRLREWDAVVTVDAPELEGERLEFVTLPDGSFLVDGDADPAPLGEAVEAELEPPFRAEAVRREGTLWAVAARSIRVVELPAHVLGNELELVARAEERTLTIDGFRSFGSVRELETLGEGEFVVQGRHLDGALWEVEVSPL
jgi:hypothetical protein